MKVMRYFSLQKNPYRDEILHKKEIEIKGRQAIIHYNLPVPPGEKRTQEIVLPTIPYGGAGGTRTPDPLRAKQVLSQLSYSPSGMQYR